MSAKSVTTYTDGVVPAIFVEYSASRVLSEEDASETRIREER